MSKNTQQETDTIEQDIRIDSNKSLDDAEAKLADPNISPSEKARLERQLSEAKANLLAKAQEIENEKTVEAKQEKLVVRGKETARSPARGKEVLGQVPRLPSNPMRALPRFRSCLQDAGQNIPNRPE